MAKVWVPDQYDEYGVLETPGYFYDDGSDDGSNYGNEGRNYPTPGSTQGSGGSPINASMSDSSWLAAINKALGTNLTAADLAKFGIGAGAAAGLAGLGGSSSKPTGYQGGIPQLTAYQPMLTSPPMGRRPGSGGINYGTGVQYRDKNGNIVFDTATPVEVLDAAARGNGYNQPLGYNTGATSGMGGGIAGGASNSDIMKLLQALGIVQKSGVNANTTGGTASVPTGFAGVQTGGAGISGISTAPGAASSAAIAPVTAEQKLAYKQWMLAQPNPAGPGTMADVYKAQGVDPMKDPRVDAQAQSEVERSNRRKDLYASSGVSAPNNLSPWEDKDWQKYQGSNKEAYTLGMQAKSDPAAYAKLKRDYGWDDATAQSWILRATDPTAWNAQAAVNDAKAGLVAGPTTPKAPTAGVVDPNKPWETASSDPRIKAIQDQIAVLNATPGDDKTRNAALNNFFATTKVSAADLAKATNGVWGEEDIKKLMLQQGNPLADQVDLADQVEKPTSPSRSRALGVDAGSFTDSPVTSSFKAAPPTSSGIDALVNKASTPMTDVSTAGIPKTGNQEIDPSTIWQNPGNPIDLGGPYIPPTPAAPDNIQRSYTPVMATKLQSLADFSQDYFDAGTMGGGAKAGGMIGHHMAVGGIANLARGRYLQGETDGMADELRTSIDGKEPAALSHGEFVVPADVVSHLGNGNSDAGAKKLYQMMDKIRMARTGNKKQGKEINPDKFMPGGLARAYAEGGKIKGYAGTDPTGSLVQAGVTGTEQNLSNWVGPYTTTMLGQAQALANTPYQAYTGPLTAGASDLQNQAFSSAANLAPNGGMATDFAQRAGNMSYTPTTTSFDATQAQTYMNPYLQASLDPQLAEARRQSDIMAQTNNAAMTKAGAFGGGRQAILTSENQRNLGTNLANITGQGYNTAYTNAMSQFNADQARKMQENQFGANLGLQGLQTGIGGANTANQIGINNLTTQAGLGATQRGIESEGIAADKAQFEEARKDPYTKLQFQQSMLNGLPISAQNYAMSQPNALQAASGGAKTVADLLKALGISTTP